MQVREHPRVLVTGATGFLGFRVVVALLNMGAEVSALVLPEQEDKLAAISNRIRVVYGDLWNRGSLKGLARGHEVVINLVGSRQANPSRGQTFQQINLVSARNAIGMAISDGVSHFVLLSVAALPGTQPADYVYSKRDAEDYLQNSGLGWLVVRPPTLYQPSMRRPVLGTLGLTGKIPPTRWLIGRYMPLPVEIAARGIAAAALQPEQYENRYLFAGDLRMLARRHPSAKSSLPDLPAMVSRLRDDADLDNVPFGWLPPPPANRRRDRFESRY